MNKKKKTAGQVYKIKFAGHLDESWTDWFHGMKFSYEEDNTTIISGIITALIVAALWDTIVTVTLTTGAPVAFDFASLFVFALIGGIIGGILLDIYGPQKVISFGSVFGIFAIITYLKLKD